MRTMMQKQPFGVLPTFISGYLIAAVLSGNTFKLSTRLKQ